MSPRSKSNAELIQATASDSWRSSTNLKRAWIALCMLINEVPSQDIKTRGRRSALENQEFLGLPLKLMPKTPSETQKYQVLPGSRICISAMIAMTMLAVHTMAFATDNFVKVSLPKGVSIELPKNWVVKSDNQRITLDSAVESGLDSFGIEQEGSELSFAANYYDDKGNKQGILNVRYYPLLELTQADARSVSAQEVSELDAALKESMIPPMKKFGMVITSWAGTQKITINGITVFLTEYRRSSVDGIGEFRVRLARVLDANKSFTLTVSYHESSVLLKPITDRIIKLTQY